MISTNVFRKLKSGHSNEDEKEIEKAFYEYNLDAPMKRLRNNYQESTN